MDDLPNLRREAKRMLRDDMQRLSKRTKFESWAMHQVPSIYEVVEYIVDNQSSVNAFCKIAESRWKREYPGKPFKTKTFQRVFAKMSECREDEDGNDILVLAKYGLD